MVVKGPRQLCGVCTPFIPALRRQRQAALCEFEVSLVYRGRFRTARATQKNPVLGKKKKKKRKEEKRREKKRKKRT